MVSSNGAVGLDWEMLEEENVKQLYNRLFKYALFLVRNKWEADDLVQDVIIKAIRSYHISEWSSPLLHKIAYHQWIDNMRKRKYEVTANTADVNEMVISNHIDELLDMVGLLMTNLTPRQAVIYVLKEAFLYQAKEIAVHMNMTEMAVKSLLHRAKRRLEKNNNSHTVESFWTEDEKERVSQSIYQSLQQDDPQILLEGCSYITTIAIMPKQAAVPSNANHSTTSPYCMAA
ncbi:sigma-70 family RNA polymerase sigma factor [Caldibacillus lycopersici]|uniref:Sigma-70 family RNA polymerase sigma factor n=1 Tax=Perspicuibacillus lycopersici TaxID=1325689 RepID=A0AAE3IUI0_9BACI|nr:sigma-70 family RNA polymerase sigma factor [Perspicuibacillus lycopersici]MCU9614432.1 sigma-70 family RNA polymerase sigma factor [Perspicuibacillus lycopersici]